jgi:hypothetical protein
MPNMDAVTDNTEMQPLYRYVLIWLYVRSVKDTIEVASEE